MLSTIALVLAALSTTEGAAVAAALDEEAPKFLLYRSLWLLTVGEAALPDAPDVQGRVNRFMVQPPLPVGMALDPTTGSISGTPSAQIKSTTYTVVATGPAGSTNFSINIYVGPADGEYADMVLHLASGSTSKGYVTDRTGAPLPGLGSAAAPIDHVLPRALEACPAGSVMRFPPGRLSGTQINFKNTHRPGDVHSLNSTAEHPVILLGDPSGGTVFWADIAGSGGGALFTSFQPGAGHLHFVNFKFEHNWIGIQLGATSMVSDNVTENSAVGFWFVNVELDGRYDYYKCPNHNPPGNVLPDGTQCGKSKWGFFGDAWNDVRVINSYVHDIQNEHSFYFHNHKGKVLIQNTTMARVGRTCIQSVNRNIEASHLTQTVNTPGIDEVMIERCTCIDPGIGCEDDHHGGSGYTIDGRHFGPVRVRGCTFRSGFDEALKAALLNKTTSKYAAPFTGAMVVARGQACERNRWVEVVDNDFRMAPGTGDRQLVELQGANYLRFSNNTLVTGAHRVAVQVDTSVHGAPESFVCGFGCWKHPQKPWKPGSGCIPPVDGSWLPAGALHYTCDNRVSNGTTFRGKDVQDMCHDPCCSGVRH